MVGTVFCVIDLVSIFYTHMIFDTVSTISTGCFSTRGSGQTIEFTPKDGMEKYEGRSQCHWKFLIIKKGKPFIIIERNRKIRRHHEFYPFTSMVQSLKIWERPFFLTGVFGKFFPYFPT